MKLNCPSTLFYLVQASPSDPENFPFVALTNKIDVDGGKSRVVRWVETSESIFLALYSQDVVIVSL